MNEASVPDYAGLLKRALVTIDQLETKLAAAERKVAEPIAVIGIGCRFPGGANDPDSFWRLLEQGRDVVTEVPKSRWDADSFYDPDPDAPGKSYTKWGSFLEDIDQFDAQFFGISPREAVSLDPQQRLLLEVTWKALEHAGIPPASLAGSQTAVYVGLTTTDYLLRLAAGGGMRYADAYTPSGTAHSVAGGRLSYVLGLHGPNVALDTACSSSLVAIHLGVQSLRVGEAALALVGGVNLALIPDGSILTSRGRMMSFDGRCKTFDASADGYVRGEGCGMIVLKRLADAQRDGDTILGVIRGSALSQDGRSSGLTAPNGPAQEAVIRAALANAGLLPEDIGYVEAHGTGTSLGDPIELKALGEVFGARPAERPLMVGSVKTNIGHTEAAAGVAGVIKAILALRHRAIPPHLHLRKPNPLFDWDRYPVVVPAAMTPWDVPAGMLRRAGVSSFGFSGTNAHVVLEEAPQPPRSAEAAEADGRPQLLMISAESATALTDLARRYSDALDGPLAPSLAALARTAAVGRSHFTERMALVARARDDAHAMLGAYVRGEADLPISIGRNSAGEAPEVVFMFTGQGAQYAGMGMQLYRSQHVFRDALDRCAALLADELPVPLLDLLAGSDAGQLDDTRYTQPALFAIEYALAHLWRSWGLEPTAVLGHSVGEYAAACIAGVFSLEDGLRLIAARGRLMSALPRDGAMAAVFADEATVVAAIAGQTGRLSIAAINGPQNIVISGDVRTVDAVLEQLLVRGIEGQRLNVSHAFHSPLMAPMLDEFEAVAATISFNPPRIGLVSNLTGRLVGAEICSPSYWRSHVRDTVRFADSIRTLHGEGYRVFVEIGPQPVLTGMAARSPASAGAVWIASLRKGADEDETMLRGLGMLYTCGFQPDAGGLWGPDAHRNRVSIPGYPFQRQSYWQDVIAPATTMSLVAAGEGHPMLGGRVPGALPVFQSAFGSHSPSWLADHRIADFVLFPAAGFLELCVAAAGEVETSKAWRIADFRIGEALVLPDTGSVAVQVVITDGDGAEREVRVYSNSNAETGQAGAGNWHLHASGRIQISAAQAPLRVDRAALLAAATRTIDVAEYYELLRSIGAHYGPVFRTIVEARLGTAEVVGRLRLPEAAAVGAAAMHMHPALLDGCIQLIGILLRMRDGASNDAYLPVGIAGLRVHRRAGAEVWCHVALRGGERIGEPVTSDLVIFDADNHVVAEIEGLVLHRLDRSKLRQAATGALPADWAWQVDWRQAPVSQTTALAGRWMVVGSVNGLGDELAQRLREHGCTVERAAAMNRTAVESLDGIVSLLALDAEIGADASLAEIEAAHRHALDGTLALAHSLGEAKARLLIVTRGTQSIAESPVNLAHAPVWGLAGVMGSEMPSLRVVRLDLDPVRATNEAELVAACLSAADSEDRVALRNGVRWVARLVPAALRPAGDPPAECLEIRERGSLSNLSLLSSTRVPPGPGQVEIRVYATGLNFRDVLNALGMYPGDPGPLGNECAGVISAIGEGVTDLAVGDEVVAMVDRSFATWVIAPAVMTVRKPSSLSFAEAATIPVTFLTAEYALRHLGQMKRGDRVLIHAVTGGVGMAATQIALRAGAIVYGTASAGKRALAHALGVQHVSDSRSLAFVDDFMRDTGGQGVDIVLNSLAGEFIPASLGLLRKGGGHFIEIGKTGIWDAQRVAENYPEVGYHALYLGEVAAARPEFVRQMLRDLLADFEQGVLKPLPQRLYPLQRAETAFRYMGQGQHVGKIVITQDQVPVPRPDASYLISGGLGGLGLASAEWLAEQGARHLVLMGRRAPGSEAETTIARLRDAGVVVQVVQADVADSAGLASALEAAGAGLPPLRGVLHAAGSVDDAMLAEIDLARFDGVMAPKVRGSWNLYQITAARPLDFFVMFSSGAGLLGAPGQANYAAANCFMDSFAHWLRARGRPAFSINWGSWSSVGMAAGVDESHQRRWAAMGLRMIEPSQGVRMLQDCLYRGTTAQMAALPLVRARLPKNLGPFFAELQADGTAVSEAAGTQAVDIRQRLDEVAPPERSALLVAFLSEQLVKVLALGVGATIDPQRSVMEMGLDSLMAMELRNRIQSSLGVRIAVGELLRGPSASQLAVMLLREAGLSTEAPSVAAEEPAWEEGSL